MSQEQFRDSRRKPEFSIPGFSEALGKLNKQGGGRAIIQPGEKEDLLIGYILPIYEQISHLVILNDGHIFMTKARPGFSAKYEDAFAPSQETVKAEGINAFVSALGKEDGSRIVLSNDNVRAVNPLRKIMKNNLMIQAISSPPQKGAFPYRPQPIEEA